MSSNKNMSLLYGESSVSIKRILGISMQNLNHVLIIVDNKSVTG